MKCERMDCFAWQGGKCNALKPECVGPECGFYKNMAEWYAESECMLRQLEARHRADLIDKYSFMLKELEILAKQ